MIDPFIACVIGVLVFLLLMALGLPVFVTLGLGAILGIFLCKGPGVLVAVSTVAFSSGYSFSFVAVTLFVFMGYLVIHHKLGENLFDTTYKWLGGVKGGLAMASSVFGALFGFMCGSGIAGVVTVGSVCASEMVKRGYDRRFAVGTLATVGGLAALIPPSTLMIIYAILTEVSLGRLLIAGIVPGLMLTAMICAYIFIRVSLKPKLAPGAQGFPWREKGKSLIHLVPVAAIFLCVLGGLYFGIWSAIEAGATGAVAALLISLAYRRVRWSTVKAACLDTVRVFGMLFMLVIGSNLMALLFFLSGTDRLIVAAILGLNLPGWAIILFMWVVMFILGGPLEPPAIMMICTPIFLPIVLALGYDLIWFGIVMALACEVATLSPPVGMSIYAIQKVAPEGVTVWDCFMAAMPYMGIISLQILIIIFFPDIVTWLPNTMIGG
jgi:C4-dicarboxylate transporter DctM subunit